MENSQDRISLGSQQSDAPANAPPTDRARRSRRSGRVASGLFIFLTDAAFLFWFGGLTFYMAVVVPVGSDVVGPDRQGEITSIVTGYLNIASAIAAAAILVQARGRGTQVCCVVILILTALLVAIRQELRLRMLEDPGWALVAGWSFYSLHRLYLWSTTIQWACGIGILTTRPGARPSSRRGSTSSTPAPLASRTCSGERGGSGKGEG